MTQELLSRHYYGTTFQGLDNPLVYETSGTTSQTKRKVLYSDADRKVWFAQREQTFREFLDGDCHSAAFDLGYYGLTSESADHAFQRLGLASHRIDFRKPLAEHVAQLNELEPDVFFTMPAILDRLLSTGALTIQPRKLIVAGDIASRVWIGHTAARLNMGSDDILSLYGCTEIGPIAARCTGCGAFHVHKHIVAETVPAQSLLADGKTAPRTDVLVVSTSARAYFPALRYVTYDLVSGFGPRHCGGIERQSFDEILGRMGSELKHGERISMHDINAAVAKYTPGADYDVERKGFGIVIRLACEVLDAAAARNIRQFIVSRNPDVAQMIDSGLIGEIGIKRVTATELRKELKRRLY